MKPSITCRVFLSDLESRMIKYSDRNNHIVVF